MQGGDGGLSIVATLPHKFTLQHHGHHGRMSSYSLKVERHDVEDERQLGDAGEEVADCIEFSAGNPRVEHITGVVHLYRNTGSSPKVDPPSIHSDPCSTSSAGPLPAATFAETVVGTAAAPSVPAPPSPSGQQLVDTLCCLAIPADMSVAEFCTFCGAYLHHIREMRVLRREAPKRVVCMVLIRFDSAQHAESFFEDLNNKPFCSLEPEILCRLVRVKSVELVHGRPAPAAVGASLASVPPPQPSTQSAAAASGAAAASSSGAVAAPGGKGGGGEKHGRRHKHGQHGAQGNGAGASQPPAASGAQQGGQQEGQRGSPVAAASQQQPSQQQPSQQPRPAAAAAAAGWSGLLPPQGSVELPSCPVCLERLDEHISGIVTTVCNHRFHSECLQKWGDTSCPVCRYCSQPGGAHSSRCSVCSTCNDLWICLICGHVGCGRYKEGHAHDHWRSSQHCYALELETQRVWDYAGDNYVHRLIQSKTDGKLVEVPSPAPSSSARGGGRGGGGRRGARGGGCSAFPATHHEHDGEGEDGDDEEGGFAPEDEGLKEALIASKLDAIAQDYNHLITTQLDGQRQYFEGLLAAAAKEAEQREAVAAGELSRAEHAAQVAAGQAREAERRRQAAEKKLSDSSASLQQLKQEKEFLHSLNETLLSNQAAYQQQLATAKAELAAKSETIKDLQEQVRDLMVYIEAGRMVEASGSDLRQATVLPMPVEEQRATGKGKAKQGNK